MTTSTRTRVHIDRVRIVVRGPIDRRDARALAEATARALPAALAEPAPGPASSTDPATTAARAIAAKVPR